jgi:alkanesulfonate monooxygenase SsuD/methylene tetrahydromethanopterin reductase-like flavin-dependent oxidoreductase (luciferase family)
MKIGVGLPNQVRDLRPTVIPGWAAAAERAGFSTLASVGRIAYPGVTDTVALAAAAGATSTIGLLSGVLLAPVWPAALLAKEIAGIDGVSGGRLTLGISSGGRPDDFAAGGPGPSRRGERLDRDLEVYRDVWSGNPFGGGGNPAVPRGTRQVPLLFGCHSPAGYARMARWGEGYIGASFPADMVAPTFDEARSAWQAAGRPGSPRLVGLAYFAFDDVDKGRENVRDFYAFFGGQMAGMVAGNVCDGPAMVKETVRAYADLGADELIFNPVLDDPAELARLAETVL